MEIASSIMKIDKNDAKVLYKNTINKLNEILHMMLNCFFSLAIRLLDQSLNSFWRSSHVECCGTLFLFAVDLCHLNWRVKLILFLSTLLNVVFVENFLYSISNCRWYRHWLIWQNAKIWGEKTRQPFSAVSGPKFIKFGACRGVPVDWRCWCQVGRNCYQQTSSTINAVDDTAYSSSSASLWTQTTVADGRKFSAVRHLSLTFRDRSKNAIFTYSTCIRRLRWELRVILSEFHIYFSQFFCTMESLGHRAVLFAWS